MVTPMLPGGAPDFESLCRLVDHLISQGVTGLLVLGSCGENGALTQAERLEVAGAAIQRAAGRVHVTVGVPALGPREAAADAARYADLGADSVLVPAPFVFPLSQAELRRHFENVAGSAGIPVLAYNLPSRVNVWLEPELLKELAASGAIVGVKDSSSNIERERTLAEETAEVVGFRRYTGSEECIDALLLGGFHGAVPGLANPFAPFHVRLAEAAGRGDWAEASAVQGKIIELAGLYRQPLPDGSFSAQVMAALKEALRQQGVIEYSSTSFPFVQADDAMRAHVRSMLDRASSLLE